MKNEVLTLRDWFAGMAMTAVLQTWTRAHEKDREGSLEEDADYIADECYDIADAMIVSRDPKLREERAEAFRKFMKEQQEEAKASVTREAKP